MVTLFVGGDFLKDSSNNIKNLKTNLSNDVTALIRSLGPEPAQRAVISG
jgi:hypothetical protein